uniref:Uncharacterized protein n=1 Tax=Strongyloides stercoralis TaxID=6248 RepID=A0A0K0DUD5_STRER
MNNTSLSKFIFVIFIFLISLINGKPTVEKDTLFNLEDIFPLYEKYMDNLGYLYQDYKKSLPIRIVNNNEYTTKTKNIESSI